MSARIEERNQWMENVVNGDEGVMNNGPYRTVVKVTIKENSE